jgi:branched-chain amino acid transport system substrate-binding protein
VAILGEQEEDQLIATIRTQARWAGPALVALLVTAACGGAGGSGNGQTTFKGVKKLGISTAITGQSALYGHAISQSMKLAVDDVNAKGGVNGYKLDVVVQDDATDVNKAVENSRQLILQDQVVALVGPVLSSQCQGTSAISKQYKVLNIAATCNSYQLTTSPSLQNPNWVSIVPSTYMEGVAAGTDTGKRGIKNIYIVSPDYLFGRSETNAFVAGLKKANPNAHIMNSQSEWYVPLNTTDWSPVVANIQAAKPDLVYSNIFAATQLGFIQKATQADPQFFQKFPLTTLASVDELQTLKDQYPLNMRLYARAPFFALGSSKMDDFVKRYRERYNEYPSDWAVMDYDAVTFYAQAANAAKSFDSAKVKAQMIGKPFDGLRGRFTVRKEDQQANVGETIGTTASSGGKFPFPTFTNSTNLKGDDLMMPVDLVKKLQAGQCRNDDFANCS